MKWLRSQQMFKKQSSPNHYLVKTNKTKVLFHHQAGFTLPELVVSIGIIMLLISLAAFSISRADLQADLNGKTLVLIADIKNQQVKAMSGETGAIGSLGDHGIYFGTNSYTTFRGSNYDPSNPTNFTVKFDSNLSFQNVRFQNSQIIFSKLSGEINNYDELNDTFSILNSPTNKLKTIEINKLGAIINEN